MTRAARPRKIVPACASAAFLALALAACAAATPPADAPAPRAEPAAAAAPALPIEPPTADYWVYVGAESSDLLHRVRFGPAGAVVENSVRVGELAVEVEGPHGLAISRDGRYLHLTTGHGYPDGKYWKYELGPDTVVGPGVLLGIFPASIDVTPDGLYTFSANFNLHGDMVPSTFSVVYTPSMMEITRIVTCVMPHGSRIDAQGNFHYSTCMMDDQLVEIDTRAFKVSRRFSLAVGAEGPLPAEPVAAADAHAHHGAHAPPAPTRSLTRPPDDPAEVGYRGLPHRMAPNSCSPTWAQPSADGTSVFVTCNKADQVVEVSLADWQIVRRFDTGRGPYNVEVTPDGALLLVTLKQGGQFEVFDLATGASVARLDNSTTVAHGVVVSPDSRYAFVSSEGVGAQPGKVDIYDLRTLTRVASVDVGRQAAGIAFWKMEPAGER